MSLMTSQSEERYSGRRRLKCSDVHPLKARHRFVLELHLAGHQVGQSTVEKPSISELSGFAPATVYAILKRDDIHALRQQIMRLYDLEFEALFPDVIQTIREGMEPGKEMKDRIAASKLWLKAHGRPGAAVGGSTINVTAEDVVFQILNQGGTSADASTAQDSSAVSGADKSIQPTDS